MKPSVELDRTLRCFVPAIIEERVQAGQTGSWVSEHRKLVSVFMKINGLGPKPCEVTDLAKASEVCGIVQERMQRFDGTITRLICDDKGTRFLIAFGLPGHANEDDESRAVVSCLQVVDALSRIKPVLPEGVSPDDEDYQAMKICVGITTGRVFCGEAGSEGVRVEYTLSGARVNLAARLMQAAGKSKEKGILCDKDTYDAVVQLGSCDFKILDPIKVKGKEEPVPIFRPLLSGTNERKTRMPGGADSRSSIRSASEGSTSDLHNSMRHSGQRTSAGSSASAKRLKRTLGREAELALLQQGLDDLGRGKGGAILLLGESGMGKTHLVEVLRSMHERKLLGEKEDVQRDEQGDVMVEGAQLNLFLISSKPIEATTPFFSWKGVFEKLFTQRTLQKIVAKTRRVKPPPPTGQAAEDAPPAPGRRQRRGSGDFGAMVGGLSRKKADKGGVGEPGFTQDLDSRTPPANEGLDMADIALALKPELKAAATSAAAGGSDANAATAVPRNVSFAEAPEGAGPASPRPDAEGGAAATICSSSSSNPSPQRDSLSKDGGTPAKQQQSPMKVRRKSKMGINFGSLGSSTRSSAKELSQDVAAPVSPANGETGVAGPSSDSGAAAATASKQTTSIGDRVRSVRRSGAAGGRQRWRDAYSSVLAFLSPSYMFEGRHCVRPSADDALLADESFVQLAPLLSPVLPIPIKDNEVTKHLTGETRMTATIRLMVTVLAAKLGEGRPVLIFEDVHWMDSSSWAVLRHALDVVKPMLVLLTLRPLPEPGRPAGYDEIVKEHKLCDNAVCELPGLSVKELRELLCEAMGVTDVQEDIFPLLAEKTNGNPFWALEFLKSMTDSKLLEVVDGFCKLTVTIDKVTLPSSVESLITSRMDRLPASQQLLMKMGSVIGTNFKTTELGFLGEQLHLELPTDTELIGLLDMLVVAEMLQREPGQRTMPEYKFKHKYLQDVSYSLLPEELKEKLHFAAAEYYEGSSGLHGSTIKGVKGHAHLKATGGGASKLLGEVHGGGGQDLVWKLSYHWSHAGDSTHSLGKAVRYLTLAGDAALGNFAQAEARKLLLDALELTNRKPELAPKRGPLQRRMAQCHMGVGENDNARQSLSSAIVSLGGEKDRVGDKEHPDGFKGMADADFGWRYRRLRMQHSVWSLFVREPKRKHNVHSGDKQEDTHPRMELAIAYELLSQVLMEEHQREQAGYCAMRALTIGYSLPTLSPVVGRAYASLCLIESAAEKSSAWMVRRYKRKALETCEQLGELGQLSYTLLAAGVLDAGQARWAMATDNLARSGSISEQLRDKRQWEQAICHQAHLEYYRGNFIDSKELYEKALASAEARFDKQIRNRCNAGIAASLLATNDLKGAIAILKSTNSFGQLALALLRSGQFEEAFERAMRVKDRFKGKRTKYYVLKAFASTAEVILELLKGAIARQEGLTSHERSKAGANTSGRVTMFGSKGSGASPPKARDSQGGGDDDEEEKPRFDDLKTLEEVALEWTAKLEQFGNIYPVAKPRALLLKGIFYAIQQNNPAAKKKALKFFRESQFSSHTLQMPYDEALATYELAKYSDASPANRLRLLQTAYEDFKTCGAQYDLQRCAQQMQWLQQAQKQAGGLRPTNLVSRDQVMSVVGDPTGVGTFRSSRDDAELEDGDEVDDEGTFLPRVRQSQELKGHAIRAAVTGPVDHGLHSALSGASSNGAAPAAATDVAATKDTAKLSNGATLAESDVATAPPPSPPPSASSEVPGVAPPPEVPGASLPSLAEDGPDGVPSAAGAQPKRPVVPPLGASPPLSPKPDYVDGGVKQLPAAAVAARKRGQGAGTEGCSMGCGSEPNEAPTNAKSTASARVESTCARPAPEETSASERTRAANGLAAPQREVTFLADKGKPAGSRLPPVGERTAAPAEAPTTPGDAPVAPTAPAVPAVLDAAPTAATMAAPKRSVPDGDEVLC